MSRINAALPVVSISTGANHLVESENSALGNTAGLDDATKKYLKLLESVRIDMDAWQKSHSSPKTNKGYWPPANVSPLASETASNENSSFSTKLRKTANAIWSAVKYIFSLPLRYFGAKDWSIPGQAIEAPIRAIKKTEFESGYERKFTKLSAEQIKGFMKYVSHGASAHLSDDKWIKPYGYHFIDPHELDIDVSELPGQIEMHDKCFFDPKTSLKALVSESEDEVVISFGALAASKSELDPKKAKALARKQHVLLATQFAGGVPKMYDQAELLVEKLKELPRFKGKKIKLSGQCLGGSLAQYSGLKHKIKTVCFNSFPLGAGLQYRVRSRLRSAKEYVTHMSTETDFVSDSSKVKYLDPASSAIGLRTPGNFGKRYSVPTAYPGDKQATHDYIQGSMMKHMGYTTRTTPEELPDSILKMREFSY